MRVLHFLPVYVPAWQYGGPILSVSRLCEGLVQIGVDVRVITTNAGLPDFPIDRLGVSQNVNGVEVFYYSTDCKDGPIRSRALVDSLADHLAWAQLLHLSSIWQPLGLQVQAAAHVANVPVIQTLRGALGPYSWRRGWWKKVPYFWLKEKPLLDAAASVHCTTRQELDEIAWLRLKNRVDLLPNPINLSHLRFDTYLGQAWRRSNGIPLSLPLFLVAGRLHHKKGLTVLPRVLQAIANQHWQIVFLGNDEDGTGALLKRQFRLVGLSDRCHWIDHHSADALSGPYNAADHLLLPSRHENFGNVVVEALACGCGVLVSDRVGVADSILSCPGVGVIPRSIVRWKKAVQTALITQRPGSLSAQWVSNHFSQTIVASQAFRLYSSIVSHV